MLKGRKLPILFNNKHYLICNKPSGFESSLVSAPKPSVIITIAEQLGVPLEELKPVQRLDKFVTGGILIPKTKAAAKGFSKNLRDGGNVGNLLRRRYVAMIESKHGVLSNINDKNINFLDVNKGIIDFDIDDKPSVTKFIIPNIKHESKELIVLELETGRKHQIRKHLNHAFNKAIYNDRKYDTNSVNSPVRFHNQIALHSAFIKSKLGLDEQNTIIGVNGDDQKLWAGFINKDGDFDDKIRDILFNFDDYFTK